MTRKLLRKLGACGFLFAAIFVFSADIEAQSKKERDRAKQLVKQADKSFGDKNYKESINQYSESFVIVPNNAEARYKKGLAHYSLKENELALAEFNLALTQGYKPALDIYKVRWDVNFKTKNFDAALSDIREVFKTDSSNADLWITVGDISAEKGAFTEALDSYQKAVVKLPGNADLHYKIANVQSKLGNTDGQATAAEEAIKKNTQFLADSYRLLGDARYKQRRFPDAIDAYQRALSSKSASYEVYRNLGEAYRSENRIDEAIETLKRGLRAFPSDGLFYTDISWYYSLAGMHEEAAQAASAGTRLLPKEYLAYTNLCRALNDSGKYQSAITACNSALRINPNDGETNFYLGRAYNLVGRPAEATKYYKLAVTGLLEYTKNNPEYSDGFYLLGNAYYADDQRDKAIEAYKKCLELNPRFSKANYNIGIILIDRKNKTGALEQYNSLLITDKDLAGKLKLEIDKL